MKSVLYHNPRCSKSREAYRLLSERSVPFKTKLYLKEPLEFNEIAQIHSLLSCDISMIIRSKEATDLGLAATTDDDWIHHIITHPQLLQRPIFIHKNKAVIGRPPEQVLTLL